MVRAGLDANIFQNAVCGSPVTPAQASIHGGYLDFTCEPTRPARYVSVDIDGNQPGETTTNVVALCEVMVEEYSTETAVTSPARLTSESRLSNLYVHAA